MIIWINGSINSGKSTVAKLLASKIKNAAIIEVDKFHEFIAWMPIKEAVPLNLQNCLSVIKNFHKAGLNVIVPYPLSEKNYQFVDPQLRKLGAQTYYITLAPSLEVALKDRGTRKLDDWERARIKYHYEIGLPRPPFGQIIDNSNQSPEETVEEILKIIEGR